MAAFPRSVLPASSSVLQAPRAALVSEGQSGIVQVRNFTQRGFRWTESFPPLLVGQQAVEELRSFITHAWARQTTFTISHRDHLLAKGTISGTALVNGASQTGESLIVDGFTGTLFGDDIFTIASVDGVFMNVNTQNGPGTLTIFPPIPTGSSPADNAVITYDAVSFNARLAEEPNWPTFAQGGQYVAGLKLTFDEVVT